MVAAAGSGEQVDQGVADMPSGSRPDIVATNAFYYYNDVEAAWRFYQDTLGFETVVDYGFAKILRLAESSYLTVVKADEGMHSADEPKIVTLHLVTDELNRWHEYVVERGLPVGYDSAVTDEQPGNSFVTIDTEGYRLEFLRFNPHPNHNTFVDSFARANPVSSTAGASGDMSIRATAFSVYYQDPETVRPFFENLFDVTPTGLIDDVPIYQLAGSGFVALQEFGDALPSPPGENGVTLSFLTTDIDAWFDRASAWPGFELRTPEVLDEGGLVRVFVGYDPTGTFLEWDSFLDVPENQALLDYLE